MEELQRQELLSQCVRVEVGSSKSSCASTMAALVYLTSVCVCVFQPREATEEELLLCHT